MEVIKISPERLMVSLSLGDMEKYSVDLDNFEDGITHTRSALRQILEDANIGSGFCMENARVLVQVFPSKKGGCEMFVTRLGEGADGVGALEGESGMFGGAKEPKYSFYSFDTFGNLLAACAAIYISGYNGMSAAFSEEGHRRFFLRLCEEYPNLSEFGAKKCKSTAAVYVDEHCRLISNDAVNRFSAFA